VDESGSQGGGETDTNREEQSLVDSISQDDHGVEAFLAARWNVGGGGDLVLAWLGRLRVDELENGLFYRGGDASDVFCAYEIDAHECDGEVGCGDDDVYAEGIPAIRLDEML